MEGTKEKKTFKDFLERQNIKISAKTYFVDAMGSMALGLFASLLIATIFETLGGWFSWQFLIDAAAFAKNATGAALGVAIAYSLKAPPLVLLSAAAVGMAGNGLGGTFIMNGKELVLTAGPAGAFVAAVIAVELGKLVSKTTKVDILVTPTVTILSGVAIAKLVCPSIAWLMYQLGNFVNTATVMQPFIMGILVSVVVGMVLTLPISSAALCAMIGITGIAGGAATVGCCAQMVGFAVISFRENRWGGLVAQGLGTSMLQMGNIIRRPIIWIPPTLAAAICGPISTMVFKLECTGVAAGMGTCGLVGPIGVVSDMGVTTNSIVGIAAACILLPAVLSLLFSEIMRKLGWIRENDMLLEL